MSILAHRLDVSINCSPRGTSLHSEREEKDDSNNSTMSLDLFECDGDEGTTTIDDKETDRIWTLASQTWKIRQTLDAKASILVRIN